MDSRVLLDEHQQTLLATLVEAARRGVSERPNFHYEQQPPATLPRLEHPGLRDEVHVSIGDIEAFEVSGLLRHQKIIYGSGSIELMPAAFHLYDDLKREDASAVTRIETHVTGYLDDPTFRVKYSDAYESWAHAARLLWSDEANQHLTTIGHLCREALQRFAAVAAGLPSGPTADPDRANTVSRIRAAINTLRPTRTSVFLDALLAYWGTISDLVQRQEHGAQKEGETLDWEDARRVVFQTANVMFELCNTLAPRDK